MSAEEGSVLEARAQLKRKASAELRPDREGDAGPSAVPGRANGYNRRSETVDGATKIPEQVLDQWQSRTTSTGPPETAHVLPARQKFTIQIGTESFKLSGASISSDGPSYFTQFFGEQLRQGIAPEDMRTLYIDRDPATFRDITLHLQGYHVEPRDSTHFVRLFIDAHLFSLPKLMKQLHEGTIYVRIGDTEFQIPRDLFKNPGDSPNYFTLGFSIFWSTPSDAFPGLRAAEHLRPPVAAPPHCLLYTSPSPRDGLLSRMPSSA